MTSARAAFDRVWMKFHRGETHDSLRDLIPAVAKKLVGKGPDPRQLDGGDFWAVRDLSFEVLPGQVLGIIGAYGSGKSTSLRILTKILEPTRGRVDITGRVGALIEVSAGFHGDLTGRENVFLQGAIMGMRSKDIARKFDEIVEFSGISAFIDTPVKRYSSGMNARLGFSIAAHLDPDVLVIDEVLAVGDFLFQERAFGRISHLAKTGIPVVIVSHQLDRIAELCTDAILLEKGNVAFRGTPADAISAYIQPRTATTAPIEVEDGTPIRLSTVQLLDEEKVISGEWYTVRIEGTVLHALPESLEPVLIRVRSLLTGRILFASGSQRMDVTFPKNGTFRIDLKMQANVPAGSYMIEVCAYDSVAQKEITRAPSVMIRVSDPNAFLGTVQFNPRMEIQAL